MADYTVSLRTFVVFLHGMVGCLKPEGLEDGNLQRHSERNKVKRRISNIFNSYFLLLISGFYLLNPFFNFFSLTNLHKYVILHGHLRKGILFCASCLYSESSRLK